MRLASLLVSVSAFLSLEAAHADVYKDLVGDDEAAKAAAALEIVQHPDAHALGVLRRAINVAATVDEPKLLVALTRIVKDDKLDGTTRATAALAIGKIGSDRPGSWPPGKGRPTVHEPLPEFARRTLEKCVEPKHPNTLRRACAEALGVAKVGEAVPDLAPLLHDETVDPLLRLFAGRAVTRITGVLSVPMDSFDALLASMRVQP